jgi:hypothetical protein
MFGIQPNEYQNRGYGDQAKSAERIARGDSDADNEVPLARCGSE